MTEALFPERSMYSADSVGGTQQKKCAAYILLRASSRPKVKKATQI